VRSTSRSSSRPRLGCGGGGRRRAAGRSRAAPGEQSALAHPSRIPWSSWWDPLRKSTTGEGSNRRTARDRIVGGSTENQCSGSWMSTRTSSKARSTAAIKAYTTPTTPLTASSPAPMKDSRRSCRGDRRSQSEGVPLYMISAGSIGGRPSSLAARACLSARPTEPPKSSSISRIGYGYAASSRLHAEGPG
jgi:hypothetical protein